MLPKLNRITGLALDVLFPPRCVGCGREGEFICPVCEHNLPYLDTPICSLCGRPWPGSNVCPDCSTWNPYIDGIRSPFRLDGTIRQAIHQFKYRQIKALAFPLSRLLEVYITANPVPAGVLVPVPLHPKRLRERGYNQSNLLARELGKLLGLPVAANCLIRTRFAIPQVKTASVIERRQNVTGAFSCRNSQLQNSRVLLIDDVSTAGATLDACAMALKAAGAASVWGLVLAREI